MEFSHFLVVDFEATCQENGRIYPQEIIEFPAVLVGAAIGCIQSTFRTYVRPRHHPRLTDFCTELTGIQQSQVDGGVELSEALAKHDAWLAAMGVATNRLAVVTWGDWDCKTMLEFECSFKGIAKPAYFDRRVNLRLPFQAAFGPGRRNLQEAVKEAGLQWVGRLHCGLDDALNTAYLLVEVMRRGVPISITGSLPPAPASKEEVEALPPPPPPQPRPPPRMLDSSTWPRAVPYRCYCGVASMCRVVMTPSLMQGRCFYGCGNFTPPFGPMCLLLLGSLKILMAGQALFPACL